MKKYQQKIMVVIKTIYNLSFASSESKEGCDIVYRTCSIISTDIITNNTIRTNTIRTDN